MTAIRVLIAWVYSNTKSVLLAQLFHAFSTGSLVVFSPPRVTAAQESLWYAVYAAALRARRRSHRHHFRQAPGASVR